MIDKRVIALAGLVAFALVSLVAAGLIASGRKCVPPSYLLTLEAMQDTLLSADACRIPRQWTIDPPGGWPPVVMEKGE